MWPQPRRRWSSGPPTRPSRWCSRGCTCCPAPWGRTCARRCVLVEALLVVEDEELHRGHFSHRPGTRPAERYLGRLRRDPPAPGPSGGACPRRARGGDRQRQCGRGAGPADATGARRGGRDGLGIVRPAWRPRLGVGFLAACPSSSAKSSRRAPSPISTQSRRSWASRASAPSARPISSTRSCAPRVATRPSRRSASRMRCRRRRRQSRRAPPTRSRSRTATTRTIWTTTRTSPTTTGRRSRTTRTRTRTRRSPRASRSPKARPSPACSTCCRTAAPSCAPTRRCIRARTCTSRPPRSAAASCARATRSAARCDPRGGTSATRRSCTSRP